MCLASFFVSESPGTAKPPEEFRFRASCPTPVPTTCEICLYCDCPQPKGGA